MATPYYGLSELMQRLRSQLPISITLTDPFTQTPLLVARDNVLAELLLDTANLGLESQLCPALYVEFARFERAAEYSAELAAAQYTKWKSERQKEYRVSVMNGRADDGDEPAPTARGKAKGAAAPAAAAKESKPGKGPTVAEVEDYYRTHADYERMRNQETQLRMFAGLFLDAKKAVEMKARIIGAQTSNMRGFEHVERKVHGSEQEQYDHASEQPEQPPKVFAVPTLTAPPGVPPVATGPYRPQGGALPPMPPAPTNPYRGG